MDAGELGVGASGDLGSSERDQLPSVRQYAAAFWLSMSCDVRLEVGELAREVLLGLVPQLGGLLKRL
jgi:hypothetical protein